MTFQSLVKFLLAWTLLACFLQLDGDLELLRFLLFVGPLILTLWMLAWWLKESKLNDDD